jgi:hypothetical protein
MLLLRCVASFLQMATRRERTELKKTIAFRGRRLSVPTVVFVMGEHASPRHRQRQLPAGA